MQSIKLKKMLNRGNKARSSRFVNICSGYLPEPHSKSPDWEGVSVEGERFQRGEFYVFT